MKFVSAYKNRNRVIALTSDKLMTEQSHKEECDINTIMRRYRKTGGIIHLKTGARLFGDDIDIDFSTAMQIVTDAQQAFAQLPAEIRDRFANSPQNYLDFVDNPDNQEEMIELGLISRSIEKEEKQVEKIDETKLDKEE